ncbi:hypothetical protein MAE02_61960 [Microvirga aerophila]|uniref:Uncharacterized protein n=1 Tax=Microvirga aerophila TaxID=670291 RepID=A0A512C2R2_9HYPH|nr:hypothetical protein MAE02_61960 [Microvirga aerophila]
MRHKYSVSQLVHAAGTHLAARTGGVAEVVRVMLENRGNSAAVSKAQSRKQRCAQSEIRTADAGRSIPAQTFGS